VSVRAYRIRGAPFWSLNHARPPELNVGSPSDRVIRRINPHDREWTHSGRSSL
jgi:hypothetical protein